MAYKLKDENLKALKPFSTLNDEQIILLKEKIKVVSAKPGKKLLKLGCKKEQAFFLLQGAIELKNARGDKREIKSGTTDAASAIAQLKPRNYQVTSKSDVTYLLIDDEYLKYFISHAPDSANIKPPEETPPNINPAHQEILLNIYEDYKNNRLELPSLPDTALRIRRMIDDDSATTDKIAHALSLDPSLSANLVRVVNTPLYRSSKKITTVSDAVVRLGFNTTKTLVTNFSLKQIFIPKSKSIKNLLVKCWKDSLQTATFCYVAAKKLRINPDEALLGGLLHQLGTIPVLQYAELYEEMFDDQGKLEACIQELKGPLGAFLLEKWEFPEAYIACAKHANHFRRTHKGKPDLADICIVGQLLTRKEALVRDIAALPAFKKVFGEKAELAAGEEMAEAANQELMDLKRILIDY